MDKSALDKWFTKNYNEQIESAKRFKSKYRGKATWEPEDIISEAYRHLHERIHKISSEEECLSYMVQFLYKSVVWTNSEINRLYTTGEVVTFIPTYKEHYNLIDEDGLDEKIRLEQDAQEKKALLAQFYQGLDMEERVIFEMMFQNNIVTLKELSNKLKVSVFYIRARRTALKNKLKEYITQYKETTI